MKVPFSTNAGVSLLDTRMILPPLPVTSFHAERAKRASKESLDLQRKKSSSLTYKVCREIKYGELWPSQLILKETESGAELTVCKLQESKVKEEGRKPVLQQVNGSSPLKTEVMQLSLMSRVESESPLSLNGIRTLLLAQPTTLLEEHLCQWSCERVCWNRMSDSENIDSLT